MPTQGNYPSDLRNLPMFDIRSPQFAGGAVGDGTHNDTAAIQAALDAAANVSSPLNPARVFVPRGKWLVTTALKFKNSGIVLEGAAMSASRGPSVSNASTLYANNTSAHDNTPMLRLNPIDGGSSQWFEGCGVRDISFEVSTSSRFNSGTPPVVMDLRQISNGVIFKNLMFYGQIGTALNIACSTDISSGNGQCENLLFENMMVIGGGTLTSAAPTGPGILVSGCDNIQFKGGLNVFNKSGGITPAGNSTDFAGIQIIPQYLNNSNNSFNNINNGCVIDGMQFANWVVSGRVSNVDLLSQTVAPKQVTFINICSEGYNRMFEICAEPTSFSPGFFGHTRVNIKNINFSGGYGSPNLLVKGSKMWGGFIEVPFLNTTGDLTFDNTTTGIEYHVSANPNGPGSFFDASDAGANNGEYCKNGFTGRILTGQTRFTGASTAPSATNASSGDCAIQAYGDTVKLWASNRQPSGTGDTGFRGEMCQAAPGAVPYLYVFFQGIGWVRFGPGSTF